MFVIFFSLFVFLLLIGINILWILIFQLTTLLVAYLTKKLTLKFLIYFLGAFILSYFSIYFHSLNHGESMVNSSFVGTGVIVSDLSGKYEFIVDGGDKVMLFSKKSYKEDQRLFVSGKLFPVIYTGTNIGEIFAFNYNKYLYTKGFSAKVIESNSIIIGDVDGGVISRFRSKFKSYLSSIYNQKYLGIVLGSTIGDSSHLSELTKQNFKYSGISHLLVVSGGNIVLVVSFCSVLLFFLPYYIRVFILCLIVTFYVLFCYGDSSILRAYIMAILGLIALFFGKIVSLKRLLSYAYIILLVIHPYYLLFDIGFLLSFGAVFGMYLLDKYIGDNYFIGKNYFIALVGPFLGTFPIVIIYFGIINFASIISNILASFLISPIVILVYVSMFFSYFGFNFLVTLNEFLIFLLMKIGELFSHYGLFLEIKTIYPRLFIVGIYGFIVLYMIFFKKLFFNFRSST